MRRPRLGQHFLRDARTLRRIVEAADLRPGQRVLEIGPGPGVLTDPMADAVGPEGRVVTVEFDPALAAALVGRWPNVEVHEGDALAVDLAALGPFDRIVANLPYQISGPVTVAFLDLLREQGWGRAVLMYQKEFADRLLAGPGSRSYGRLSVHLARWCRVEPIKEVPPAAFNPPPKVRSSIVALVPHEAPPFEVPDERLWQAVVDGTFQNRRKQLRNTLPAVVRGFGVPDEDAVAVLESLGLAGLRPEALAPEAFAALVAALHARRR